MTSVKLWLAYRELGIMADDAQVHAIMARGRPRGRARPGPLRERRGGGGHRAAAAASAGRSALSEHGRARPIALEAEAVHRFLRLAEVTGADTYVVHVSGREPLEEIRAPAGAARPCSPRPARTTSSSTTASTPATTPLRFMMTPPLRPPADCAALWDGLRSGAIDTLASDHGHLRLDADKVPAAGDVTAVPYGIPGIQWRLALAMTHGVRGGRLSLERLVEVACAAPARAFGLYARKGTLRPGRRRRRRRVGPGADVVVGDDTRRDGLDYSPYDGMALEGPPRIVVAGGEVVAEDGVFLGRENAGPVPAAPAAHGRRRARATRRGDGLAAAR